MVYHPEYKCAVLNRAAHLGLKYKWFFIGDEETCQKWYLVQYFEVYNKKKLNSSKKVMLEKL